MAKKNKNNTNSLLACLKTEKETNLKNHMYQKLQLEFTYNSNRIEGNNLSYDQVRSIYETNTLNIKDVVLKVDDIVETANHFQGIDLVIDSASTALTESLIKNLHRILKTGTTDSRKEWFVVGDYKRLANEIARQDTTEPEMVAREIKALLAAYKQTKTKTLEDLLAFHVAFERIHPFQDGNGRVGRLILLKECLKYDIVPFIIDEDIKSYYYRGLKEWNRDRKYLLDTCLLAQDKFKAYLDYFEISYNN